MHLDARGLFISTASGKAAAAYDYLVTGSLTQIMRHVPVTVDCLALGPLVDCAGSTRARFCFLTGPSAPRSAADLALTLVG